MVALKLTDKEFESLMDCLEANRETHLQRVEDYKYDKWECTKRLIDGYKGLWKKVYGEKL